jgi:UDP-glucuronate decarboxylase
VSKKILVTGGTGFLGTNLCLRLLSEGHQVIALDNFFTGTQANLRVLQKHNGFSFIKADVVDPFPDIDADEVYHLACPASPPHYQRDPIYTTKTSIWGALNALDFATKRNTKILQASTSEVYGDPEEHPQTENYRGSVNTLGIRACYDEGKRAAETLFMDYYRQKNTKIKIMRIFNTYGPYMAADDGRVVSNFICQALKGEALTIYGDGIQTRSFCYVDDLIDGMMRLMNSPDDVKGPINIGNPEEFTVMELAEKIQKKLGKNMPFVFKAMPGDDPLQRQPDIGLAQSVLSWKPKTTLDEGLDKTIPWFKQVLGL